MPIVLAIDPGPTQSAFCLWNGQRILDKGILDNYELLGHLKPEPLWCADRLVIEQVKTYGMAASDDILFTVFWSGRFVQEWTNCYGHDRWQLVPRKTVVTHHCHSSRGGDSNVRVALIDRFGAPGTKKNQGLTYGVSKDIWSAFAIAVWWTDRQEIDARKTA